MPPKATAPFNSQFFKDKLVREGAKKSAHQFNFENFFFTF